MFFFIKKQFFLENKEFIKLEPQKQWRQELRTFFASENDKKKEEGNLPFGLTFAINYSSTQWTSKEPYKVWHGSYFTWNIGMVEITLSQREPISSSWNRRVSIYQFANVLINISFIMVYNSNNSKLSKLITTISTLGN